MIYPNKSVEIAAGALLRVTCVQPRAKRVWLRDEVSGTAYGMAPSDLGSLEVAFYPDELSAHVALVRSGLLPAAVGESK